MTREEEFAELITKARVKANDERMARLPLAEWWREVKDEVVKPMFTDAVAALRGAGFDTASQVPLNGRGILLQAGNPSLKLELVILGDYIQVISTADKTPSALWNDRKFIVEEGVREAVSGFLESVVRQAAVNRSVDY